MKNDASQENSTVLSTTTNIYSRQTTNAFEVLNTFIPCQKIEKM